MSADDRLDVSAAAVAQAGDGREAVVAPSRVARRPLASLLAEAGVASEEQLRLAVAEGMGSGERLGEVVLRRGWVDQAGLARLLARQWDLAFVDDELAVAEPGAAGLLSVANAGGLAACVIGFAEGVPLVAVAEPSEERFAAVRSLLGPECAFVVVTKDTLERLLAQIAAAEAEAEAEAEAVQASAVAAGAAADERTDLLLADLDSASTSLAAVRERVVQLMQRLRPTETELAACREQLTARTTELASERRTVERLESELAHQRELFTTVKAHLAEVTRALAADEEL